MRLIRFGQRDTPFVDDSGPYRSRCVGVLLEEYMEATDKVARNFEGSCSEDAAFYNNVMSLWKKILKLNATSAALGKFRLRS